MPRHDRPDDASGSRAELASVFAFLVQDFDEVLESDEVHSSFGMARDMEGADAYSDTIVERVSAVGPIRAACEDVADAFGQLDYDEAIWAMRVVAAQWRHVADSLDVSDRSAMQVRLCVERLEIDLATDGTDLEMLADLITIAHLDARLLDLALLWRRACDDDAEEAFWDGHHDEARQGFAVLGGLKADLRRRGELGLDDDLLLNPDD